VIQFMLLRRGRFSGEVLGTNGSVICRVQRARADERAASSGRGTRWLGMSRGPVAVFF
jgi:hypothetical protein